MPLISVAQYFPLVKNNAIWRESITHYDGSTFTHYRNQFVLLGDTLIDSKMYKKLYNANYDSILTNLEYGGAIREDRRKKCFFLNRNEANEFLLYDFSLGVGDNCMIENMQDSVQIVTSIDSIFVSNQWRKRWNFNQSGMSFRMWIEGIGDTKGLFFSVLYEFENYNLLNCYQDSGIFWTNPLLTQFGTDCFHVGIDELNKFKKN